MVDLSSLFVLFRERETRSETQVSKYFNCDVPESPLTLSLSLRGVEVIRSQIQEREQQHLLDMEKKDQETQAMLKYLERLQAEDMEQLQKKRDAQHRLMEEVAKCNDVSILLSMCPLTSCVCDMYMYVE